MAKGKGDKKIPVENLKHKDRRTNIPTEELRNFVQDDENKPKSVEYKGLLYARDPSLDPQLVWKGKDEQDREALAVPAVPVYIQEKIHPRFIIEDIRKQAQKDQPEAQADLFGDFNGIKFEEMVEFYQHDMKWSNRMILGDSLLVMNSLAEKEGMKGKVQMIYMDPPYGIKFGSNWQVSTRKRNVTDSKATDATRQPEQVKAFRDTWQLGINSYLSYLRDRLTVSRELLTESGSCFLQIGDENVHLVRSLMDEIFGSENFVSQISFAKTTGFSGNYLSSVCDSIIWYAKSLNSLKYRELYRDKQAGEEGASKYRNVGSYSALKNTVFDDTRFVTSADLTSQGASNASEEDQTFKFRNKKWVPPSGLHWKTKVEGLNRVARTDRIIIEGESIRYLRFMDDFPAYPSTNIWLDIGGIQSRTDPKIYVVQTATEAIKRCILMSTDPGDLVIDPTCGSGTTAYVAEQCGRRWITTDTSRVALALARTRLMAAKYPYYLLADSDAGIMKDAEITGKTPSMPLPKTEADIKKGFVYKRVPHVTLKSIANNEELDTIYENWNKKLEPLRAELNKALKQKWDVWEVPGEADSDWPEKAKQILSQWRSLRRECQKEMDDSISKHGDFEFLYDQPFEDNKRLRVTGPFTVESLSPHRVLATDEQRPVTEVEGKKQSVVGQFENTIIENLRKAGIQGTKKDQRFKFDHLEPFSGLWVHAVGEYKEKGGQVCRVAISIGPEHGTVGRTQVTESAKEAMKGAGFDLLIICGFAFDAMAGETVKELTPDKQKPGEFAMAEAMRQYGKLPILLARMNPDLAMGDELLKKTGTGNLFMVFGEPDVDIKKTKDGKLTVKVNGVDVYDPTTGEVRSNTTDDIACWFIDTDYNGESFFVRHAYFTGAEEPYDKLKRALRSEIDESAWSALYKTESRPFERPDTGKIAIKVINHYGDEVLKVYEIKK